MSASVCDFEHTLAARKAAARSSSRQTMVRTGSPRSRSSPVTARPTAPS